MRKILSNETHYNEFNMRARKYYIPLSKIKIIRVFQAHKIYVCVRALDKLNGRMLACACVCHNKLFCW